MNVAISSPFRICWLLINSLSPSSFLLTLFLLLSSSSSSTSPFWFRFLSLVEGQTTLICYQCGNCQMATNPAFCDEEIDKFCVTTWFYTREANKTRVYSRMCSPFCPSDSGPFAAVYVCLPIPCNFLLYSINTYMTINVGAAKKATATLMAMQ